MGRTLGSKVVTAGWVLVFAGLFACGGGGGTKANPNPDPGDPPVGDLTVVARVVSSQGVPVSNVAVLIDGAGPVLTDALGRAEFTQVAVPYEAVVVHALGGAATVYQGLTRSDPMFTVSTFRPERTLSLEGTVSGGTGFPMPPSHALKVYGHFEGVGTITSFGPSPVTGYYQSPGESWWGDSPIRMTLLALQYEVNADGHAVTYTGYGTRTITVEDGDALSNVDLILSAIGTETLSGTVTVPPDFTPSDRNARLERPGGIRLILPPGSWDASSFAVRVPTVPDATYAIWQSGLNAQDVWLGGWVEGIRPPQSGLQLEVPYATECGFPIQGATGVDYETPFLAGPDEDGRVVTFNFQAQAGGPMIVVTTTDPTVTIPDLSAYGMGIAPGTPCRWKVEGNGPFATLDEYVDPEFVAGPIDGLRSRFHTTMTQWWEFTFGP